MTHKTQEEREAARERARKRNKAYTLALYALRRENRKRFFELFERERRKMGV